MDSLIITVAGIGAELSRSDQPNLPITPDEVAADAAQCEEAGASIYHLHVRDQSGRPTMDVPTFRSVRDAIVATTSLIVQFTTGGAVGDREEDRIRPLELRPEMASLTTGTVNFGDEIFSNPIPLVTRFYVRMRELGVLPEFEIFEPGMIATAERLYAELGDGHHKHFDFVLNVPGAMPAWPDAVDFLAAHVPQNATWSATAIGRPWLDVADRAIELGGHVRTGFEDVRYVAKGELAQSNAQLVERIVERAQAVGRAFATPIEARALLGLEGKAR